MRTRRVPPCLLFLLSAFALTGCTIANTAAPAADTAPATIAGHAFGGQQPIAGATVTVYAVGSSGYGTGANALASTTTGTNGSFAFGGTGSSYTCPATNTPLYLVVTGSSTSTPANDNLALMAAVGPCTAAQSASVFVNEVTTAATILALGQFMTPSLGSGVAPSIGGTCSGCASGTYNQGLVQAMEVTYPQLVKNATGTAVPSSTSGSLTITTEAAKLNTIANVLSGCINSSGETSILETTTVCGQLFNGVNATSAFPRPYTTIQAALMMALYPAYNVSAVFNLSPATGAPFVGLASAPHDWTVALSFTTSALGLGIQNGTSSSLDIDTDGNVWFPSNKSGAVGIASFSPSTATFSSAAAGTGLTYPQYVAIDTSSPAYAWTTDLSSANIAGAPTLTGTAISLTDSKDSPGGAITVESSNKVLAVEGGVLSEISSGRNSVTSGSSPSATPVTGLSAEPGISNDGGTVLAFSSGWCGNEYFGQHSFTTASTTSSTTCGSGGALTSYLSSTFLGVTVASTTAQLCDDQTNACQNIGAGTSLPQSIAPDGAGNYWFANAGAASVSEVAPTFGELTIVFTLYASLTLTPVSTSGYLHGTSYGATMTTPYGIAIDRSGNVWVSNASCVSTTSTPCSATSFTLSEVIGAARPILTPLAAAQNAQATSGYTRPTN